MLYLKMYWLGKVKCEENQERKCMFLLVQKNIGNKGLIRLC